MANSLSVANGEFDQVAMIRRNRWVSVSGIIEFQNRNRINSIIESDRANYVSWGINIVSTSHNNIFR